MRAATIGFAVLLAAMGGPVAIAWAQDVIAPPGPPAIPAAPAPGVAPIADAGALVAATPALTATADAGAPLEGDAAPAPTASASSEPPPPPTTGYQLAARVGFSFPVGNFGDIASGAMPLWIEGLYRLQPNILVGPYARVGPIFSVAGTGLLLDFGAEGQYRLAPVLGLDPWLGAGIGYELLDIPGGSASGLELFNIGGGFDYRPGLGAFVSFSLDHVSGVSGGWLTFGVRGTYDL